LKDRKGIKLPSGKHEHMPILNHLDEADLVNIAIKNRNISFDTNPKYRL
jgi:hypothetical protein